MIQLVPYAFVAGNTIDHMFNLVGGLQHTEREGFNDLSVLLYQAPKILEEHSSASWRGGEN